MLPALLHFPYVRGGVDDGMPAQVEARLAAAVEHMDLRGVANPVQDAVQRHGVIDTQSPCLSFRNRRLKIVVRHQPPRSAFLRSSCTGLSPTQIRSSAR